jgi:hypothetical protein
LFQKNPGIPIETTQKETPSPESDINDVILISEKKKLSEVMAGMDKLKNDLDVLVVLLLLEERRHKSESEVIKLKARFKLYDKSVEIGKLRLKIERHDTREVLEEMEGANCYWP